MTTSNARNFKNPEITVTAARRKRNSLAAQKAAGLAMLLFGAVMFSVSGELAAAAILCPIALAAVFSKEKLLDFRIFGSARRRPHSSSASKIFSENGAVDTERLCPNRL